MNDGNMPMPRPARSASRRAPPCWCVNWTNAEFILESISAIVLLALYAFIAYKRRKAVTWALGALRGGAGVA
jgi:hypothetical protein